jgi:cytoskeletal protein CcmA (bactofilin family)
VIGAGTRIRGRVTGEGDITIAGRVEGEVHLRGELFVAEGGQVVSDIDADALRVAGDVEGNIQVTGEVTILAGARVRGDVRSGSVSLDEGASFDGRLDCDVRLPRELLLADEDEDGATIRR